MNNTQKLVDTTVIAFHDSTVVISQGHDQIILFQDYKSNSETKNEWNPILIDLLFPIVIAALVSWITAMLYKNKNNAEITKLKEETNNLKKSFQPAAITALQAVQDKVIGTKIQALSTLIDIRQETTAFNQKYDDDGEPIIQDEYEYLRELFLRYNSQSQERMKTFHYKYSYLFPDRVFDKFGVLLFAANALNSRARAFDAVFDGNIDPSYDDVDQMKELIKSIDGLLMEIRKDCHLDSDTIHEFIKDSFKK